jgi:hypothetical protein
VEFKWLHRCNKISAASVQKDFCCIGATKFWLHRCNKILAASVLQNSAASVLQNSAASVQQNSATSVQQISAGLVPCNKMLSSCIFVIFLEAVFCAHD